MRLLLSVLIWILIVMVADPGAALAQQEGRVYKLGWLWIGRPNLVQPPMEKWTGPLGAFRDALQDKGFVIGKNLNVDVRHGFGDIARLAPEAASLVASNVDVIVTAGTPATKAAIEATKRLPIVFVGAALPVERGLVASLAHPGGNVTGIAVDVAARKTFQLLRDASPTIKRAVYLNYAPNSAGPTVAAFDAASMEAAASIGLKLSALRVNSVQEIEPALAEIAKGGDAGLLISSDDTLFGWRAPILDIAYRHRLITVCDALSWSAAGCTVTYGDDQNARLQRVATVVAKVLKGAKPADIPVEQPATYKLIINTRTAKALGVVLPSTLLTLADEVIE